MDNKVKIYFEKKSNKVYVRLEKKSKQSLNLAGYQGWNNLKIERQKNLCDKIPELKQYLNKKVSDYEEYNIYSLIKKENEENQQTQISWFLYWDDTLIKEERPFIELELEQKVKNRTYFEELEDYCGDISNSSIIDFIKNFNNDRIKNRKYIIIKCANCQSYFYSEKNKYNLNYLCPKCNFKNNIEDLNNDKFEFGMLANTILKVEELNKINIKNSEKQDLCFFYKKSIYEINLADFYNLHKSLYRNCAISEIFKINDDKKIVFQKKYINYVNLIKKNGLEIPINEKEALAFINNPENSIDGNLYIAFYWFFNEFELINLNSIYFSYNNNIINFKRPEEYAQALINSKNDELYLKTLLGLFNKYTCKYFLKGKYQDKLIELSRLIYDFSNEKFVYFNDDYVMCDFDYEFINELSNECSEEEALKKFLFLENIRDDEIFWNKIKGNFDEFDENVDNPSEFNTIYDKLCFYQYAITGHKLMCYRSLKIENSERGVEYIKNIIKNAYLSKEEQKTFKDFIQLLFNTSLVEKMEVLQTVKIFKENNEFNFIETIKNDCVTIDDKWPSIETYLFCLDTVDINTKIFYMGDAYDIFQIARKMFDQNKSQNEMIKIVEDTDINKFIKYIFVNIYDNIKSNSLEVFKKLLESVDEIVKNI